MYGSSKVHILNLGDLLSISGVTVDRSHSSHEHSCLIRSTDYQYYMTTIVMSGHIGVRHIKAQIAAIGVYMYMYR